MLKVSINKVQNAHIFQLGPFTFITLFSHVSNILDVHKVTVFITRYFNADRFHQQGQCVYGPLFQCWKIQFSQQTTLYSHLSIRALSVQDLNLSPSPILWKCTRSQCLWPDTPAPGSINKVHYVHIKFLAWFPHQVKYYESIQGHCAYGPTFSAERPSSVNNLQNVHIFQFMHFTFMASLCNFPTGFDIMKGHCVYDPIFQCWKIQSIRYTMLISSSSFTFMTLFSTRV